MRTRRSRTCGSCNKCCVIAPVPELEKPANTVCAHLQHTSPSLSSWVTCNRYETRPQSCQDFECSWRQGIGNSGARPDKSGLMGHPYAEYISNGTDIGATLVIVETRPGALERSGNRKLVRQMASAAKGNQMNIVTQRMLVQVQEPT